MIDEKNKQSKICDIKYNSLEIQEYFMKENKNTEISQVIFKLRGNTLDIKTQKKWKYEDDLCVGCGERSENSSYNINSVDISDIIEVAKRINKLGLSCAKLRRS
jgi:hypothetical protein